MQVGWQDVDRWRVERGLSKAEFARVSGIPENTLYRGLRHSSVMNPTTRRLIQQLFPEKFEKRS